MRTARAIAAVFLALGLALAAGACGESLPSEGGSPQPRCGDGECDGTSCETPVRCPMDCGTCSGAGCIPETTPDDGTCGSSCSDSCGCAQPNEVCTADLDGSDKGTCMPVGCGVCSSGTTCAHEIDDAGRCVGGACS